MTVTTKSPTASAGTGGDLFNAYADGGGVAYTDKDAEYAEYYTYAFGLASDQSITRVRVRLDCYQGAGGNDKWSVVVSNDNGGNWGAAHDIIPNPGAETTQWLDVTSDFSWDYTGVNAIRVKITHVKITGPDDLFLDWIPIEVTHEAGVVTGWLQIQYTETVTPGAFNKVAYVGEPPTPGAWNKIKQTGD